MRARARCRPLDQEPAVRRRRRIVTSRAARACHRFAHRRLVVGGNGREVPPNARVSTVRCAAPSVRIGKPRLCFKTRRRGVALSSQARDSSSAAAAAAAVARWILVSRDLVFCRLLRAAPVIVFLLNTAYERHRRNIFKYTRFYSPCEYRLFFFFFF